MMKGDGERRPLKAAVVGADVNKRGFGPRAHLPAVLNTPGIELAAICTAHDDTAEESARLWNAPKWYGNPQALMADPEIDLVTIAVDVRAHYPIARAAVEAGKIVYCEWPLCANPGEAAELARLAQVRRARTATGTQGRFSPGIRYAHDLLCDGAVGQPLFFHLTHFLPRFAVRSDHWWSAEGLSGALNVATAHSVEPLQFLLGGVTDVCAATGTLLPDDHYADTGAPFKWAAKDTVSVLTRLEGGVQGTIHVSNLSTQQGGFHLDVFGSSGQLVVAAPRYISYTPARVYRARHNRPELETLPIPERYFHPSGLSEDATGFNISQALTELTHSHWEGTAFHPDFADGYRLHCLIEAMNRSSETQGWISV